MKQLLLQCSLVAIGVFALAATANSATFTVTKIADTNDGVCDSDCSLREAIAAANVAPSDDVIEFNATLFALPQTIVLSFGALVVIDSSVLSISGPGRSLLTISGNQQSRVLSVEPNATFSATDLTIANGKESGDGGGLRNQIGTVVLTNVGFVGNRSENEGGAILTVTRSLTLNNCYFFNNSARLGGGAISSDTFTQDRPTVTINSTQFESNSTEEGVGGAIGSSYELNVWNSLFKNNSARSGGAASGGTYTDTVFEGNSAVNYGGALAGTGNLTNVQFRNNVAGVRGGAIDQGETVGLAPTMIVNSSFTNNRSNQDGGAIYTFRSRFSIRSSVLSNNSAVRNGGAIFSNNTFVTADILVSTVSNNSAGKDGGAIFNAGGQLDIAGSLFLGNTATSAAGEGGGAFYNEIATINLTNSTVAGNSTEKRGGALFNRGTAMFVNSTVAGNQAVTGGGGVFNFDGRSVTARLTIFADNVSTTPSDAQDFRGTITSQGYNLIENTLQTTVSGTTTGNILNRDPQLVALRNNGGPTATMGLQPTSPAIDAGDPNNFPSNDQRGVGRAQDGDFNGTSLPDIGAYERQHTFFTVNKHFDTNDGVCDGDCSLREALAAAATSVAPDKAIVFDSTIFAGSSQITLMGEELVANSGLGTLAVYGPGANLLTIHGNFLSRVLYVRQGSIVALNEVTISGGNGMGANPIGEQFGGAIFSIYAVLSLRGTSVTGNDLSSVKGSGGGIYNYGGTLRLFESTISYNGALNGGGLYNSAFGGYTELVNTSVIGNYTDGLGGGVNNAGTIKVVGGVFRHNSAGLGAGIYTSDNAEIDSTLIEQNLAQDSGGGIYSLGIAHIERASILDNLTWNRGAGLGNVGGSMTVKESTISRNKSYGIGGGISNEGTLALSNSTVSFNVSVDDIGPSGGGGVASLSESSTNIVSSTLFKNSAPLGGGIMNSSGSVSVRNTIVANNLASTSGPDVNGPLTSEGFNLISSTSGAMISTNGPNDILEVDPMLDPVLRNNGGPTLTHASRPGSPVIDKGGPSTPLLTSDQRGSVRPVDFGSYPNAPGGDGSDIGAVELHPSDHYPTPFDFDGDGKADRSVYRPGEGNWYVDGSETGFAGEVQWGIATDRVVAADYDGDGRTDHAVYRDGTWWVMGSNGGASSVEWGISTDVPVPADYDGDGKADLAVYRDGTWWILYANGTASATEWGISTDKPVPADYDGDGKADLAVYRDGTWWVMNSDGSGVSAIEWGISTDKPVPADYDGDGMTDLAVYRDGTWWIMYANGSVSSTEWGISTDKPVPADYDGDGKADLAVYRDGDWWVINSNGGGASSTNWGLATDRPIPNRSEP